MGLDIYLYKSNDIDAHAAWNAQREKACEKAPEWSKADKGAAYDAFMARWDAEHPDHSPEEKIEIDSKVYPDHLFKVGYLRSSYNGGGIERVLGNAQAARTFSASGRAPTLCSRRTWPGISSRSRSSSRCASGSWASPTRRSSTCTGAGEP